MPRFNFRSFLSGLPPALPSVLCVAAILWLTLAPKPLGDMDAPLFPGADKAVHAIMFGGLTVTALLDLCRAHGWRTVKTLTGLGIGAAASLFGVAIEFVQRAMDMGRGYDPWDMCADTAGAFIAAAAWLCLQQRWCRR